MVVSLVLQLRSIGTKSLNQLEEMGKNFIILGNINWEKQTDTHEFINGVLELWKKTK